MYLLLQVDKLNADLLSECARHDKLVQELNDRHNKELSLTKQRFEEEIARLHSEMEQLQKGVVKVMKFVTNLIHTWGFNFQTTAHPLPSLSHTQLFGNTEPLPSHYS